jgi:ribosomal protein S18 acetylase RimI-like enzyme
VNTAPAQDARHPSLRFRPATPADADAAVPLIYSSGPAAFDYVFAVPGRGTAQEFLRRAFTDGAGEFGCRNHVVGLREGRVVAAGAAWNGSSTLAFTLAAARQILGFYGPVAGTGVIVRGLRIEAVIKPPARDCWYLAHLGVAAELRSLGVGAALVAHLLAMGRERSMPVAALDVAVTNPRAQRLYERLGFVVTRECESRLANAQATVASLRRMELRLIAA